MKFKAIITDLDGTAIDSPKEKVASNRLAKSITDLESHGIKVCAATGRAPSFARPLLGSMNLHGPAIVSGGTKIINPLTGDDLWSCGLTDSQMDEIYNRVKDLKYGLLWNDSTEEDYLNGGWPIDRLSKKSEIYFFEICFVPDAELDSVLGQLSDIDNVTVTVVVAQRPGMRDLHITNSKATKEHAIYELEKMIGVDKSEMIGIGDGHNDLHLFNAVGYKVAMRNAVPELKQAADKVIGSVAEDGLAIYFEELAQQIEMEET